MIKEIPEEMRREIRSQQYIHSTYIIIKELVENSLDAHATQVNIQVGDRLVVEDNGDGIEDLDKVCRCGYTSKEDTSYSVLGIESRDVGFSHGFRGQALAAVSELCDVEISTKTRQQEGAGELGHAKDFRTGATRPCPRECGTTVKVHNLFRSCAIRRRLDERAKRKNLAQIVSLIQSFCYVYSVHFTVLDRGKLVFASQGSERTREYAIKRHGKVFLESEDDAFHFMLFPLCRDKSQIIALQKRIVVCSKITNMLNSVFRRYFDYQPTFVLLLNAEADVNVSVDKTEVVIKDFKYIEHKISSEVDLYFSHQLFIQGAPKKLKPEAPERRETLAAEPSLDLKGMALDVDKGVAVDVGKEVDGDKGVVDVGKGMALHGDKGAALHGNKDAAVDAVAVDHGVFRPQSENARVGMNSTVVPGALNAAGDAGSPSRVKAENTICAPKNAEEGFLGRGNTAGQGLLKMVSSQPQADGQGVFASAYSFLKEEDLEHPNVSIQKADFKDMRILGQFNQGFILCTLEKDDCVFLITVDQHAADEIYNFERLKQSFFLKKQKLIVPVDLDVTPLQQLVIEDNTAALERNGFELDGKRLLTIPVYKGYFFTVKDFFSLLENIQNGVYESEKFRDIMASKACRTSVMIGSKLSLQEMRRIVDGLSALNLPWCCPHGRPTFKIITKL